MNTADSANELSLEEFQRGAGDAKTVALEDIGERLVGCLAPFGVPHHYAFVVAVIFA